MLFWAAVIHAIPHFKQNAMLEWRVSMLALAAAAKEERLKGEKGTAWRIKLTHQIPEGLRWKITCLGNTASRLGVTARQSQCREWGQCRCKQPESCARSQQERIRQGADTSRPMPPTGTHKSWPVGQSWSTSCFFVRSGGICSLCNTRSQVDKRAGVIFRSWTRFWEL